nr:MAG TPA: hypothetical protein [Bacteriophage sp.]
MIYLTLFLQRQIQNTNIHLVIYIAYSLMQ